MPHLATLRTALLGGLAALALAPAAARSAPARPEGHIQSDDTRIEILGRSVKVGETVQLPEGFIRVEEAGPEDREVGSFSVVPAASFARAVEAEAGSSAPAPAAAPSAPEWPATPAPCSPERTAYLRTLLRTSGIEVSDPEALLAGLEAGEGASAGYGWFALQTDPLRPLAWSAELRERAEALSRCAREGLGLARR